MDILFFFSVAGVAIVILILKFDKKQTTKVNAVLRESRSVPPLFLLKSTEQKISVLRAALKFEDAPKNMATAGTIADIYGTPAESKMQSKVHEFKLLASKYNSGQISIEAYNIKLDELLEEVQSLNGSFGLAC